MSDFEKHKGYMDQMEKGQAISEPQNILQYKGYIGSVEFSEEDNILFGKVQGIRSLISYEGETTKELVEDFRGAVDDYLEMCKANDITPEVSYKGS